MTFEVTLPDDIADALTARQGGLPRAVLESVALEGYRNRELTEEQVRRLLGFESRFDVHDFLKRHGVFFDYAEEDLAHDREVADELGL